MDKSDIKVLQWFYNAAEVKVLRVIWKFAGGNIFEEVVPVAEFFVAAYKVVGEGDYFLKAYVPDELAY